MAFSRGRLPRMWTEPRPVRRRKRPAAKGYFLTAFHFVDGMGRMDRFELRLFRTLRSVERGLGKMLPEVMRCMASNDWEAVYGPQGAGEGWVVDLHSRREDCLEHVRRITSRESVTLAQQVEVMNAFRKAFGG